MSSDGDGAGQLGGQQPGILQHLWLPLVAGLDGALHLLQPALKALNCLQRRRVIQPLLWAIAHHVDVALTVAAQQAQHLARLARRLQVRERRKECRLAALPLLRRWRRPQVRRLVRDVAALLILAEIARRMQRAACEDGLGQELAQRGLVHARGRGQQRGLAVLASGVGETSEPILLELLHESHQLGVCRDVRVAVVVDVHIFLHIPPDRVPQQQPVVAEPVPGERCGVIHPSLPQVTGEIERLPFLRVQLGG
mmetsp:Transcript_35897/g.90536  ORF Transcript_35897/g.90536 Transcript_35897/m.90536 type:complete len:253 (+) Transcript_35897:179-937(+)